MLVMAIEGARQLAGDLPSISGYCLEDVAFLSGFAVPMDSDTMEAQLYFYPRKTIAAGSPLTHDFKICAHFNNKWSEICQGSITVKLHPSGHQAANDGPVELQRTGLEKLLTKGCGRRWEKINTEQFYENLALMGYDLGPAFQT
jgi:Polyketide synthase dehydratase